MEANRTLTARAREINVTRMIIDGTLWELHISQLCEIADDSAMSASVRNAANRELDAKFDRGIQV